MTGWMACAGCSSSGRGRTGDGAGWPRGSAETGWWECVKMSGDLPRHFASWPLDLIVTAAVRVCCWISAGSEASCGHRPRHQAALVRCQQSISAAEKRRVRLGLPIVSAAAQLAARSWSATRTELVHPAAGHGS